MGLLTFLLLSELGQFREHFLELLDAELVRVRGSVAILRLKLLLVDLDLLFEICNLLADLLGFGLSLFVPMSDGFRVLDWWAGRHVGVQSASQDH